MSLFIGEVTGRDNDNLVQQFKKEPLSVVFNGCRNLSYILLQHYKIH